MKHKQFGIVSYLKFISQLVVLRPYLLLIVIVSISCQSLYYLMVPTVLGWFIRVARTHMAVSDLFFLIGLSVVIYIIYVIASYVGTISIAKLTMCSLAALRTQMFNKIYKLPFDVRLYQDSDVLSHFSVEVSDIERGVAQVLPGIIMGLIQFVIGVVFLFFFNWKLAFIPLLFSILLFFLYRPLDYKATIQNTERRTVDVKYFAEIQENLKMMVTIVVYNLVHQFKVRHNKKNDLLGDSIKRSVSAAGMVQVLVNGFGQLLIFIIIIAGMCLVYVGDVLISQLIPFIMLTMTIFFSATMLTSLVTIIMRDVGSINRIRQFLVFEEIKEGGDKLIIEDITSICIEEACVKSYDGHNILKKVSVNIPHKQTTMIVGVSGSGKSTLLHAILSQLKLDSGIIKINGIDLKQIDIESYYHLLGFVSQQPLLFNLSIADNLRLANPYATKEDMIQVSKLVLMYDRIMSLAEGFDYIFHKNNLSLGECQRLSLAMALIRKPKVLILDEVTSALDSINVVNINKIISQLQHQITIIIVSHNLSMVEDLDNIIVMKSGLIVEYGSHKELLNKKGEYYKIINHY